MHPSLKSTKASSNFEIHFRQFRKRTTDIRLDVQSRERRESPLPREASWPLGSDNTLYSRHGMDRHPAQIRQLFQFSVDIIGQEKRLYKPFRSGSGLNSPIFPASHCLARLIMHTGQHTPTYPYKSPDKGRSPPNESRDKLGKSHLLKVEPRCGAAPPCGKKNQRRLRIIDNRLDHNRFGVSVWSGVQQV